MHVRPDLERVRAVVLDVDGTLAGADHEVSDRNLGALRDAQEAGLAVILVTGRTLFSALAVARQAGLPTPVISCNGAVTADPGSGEPSRTVFLPHDEVVDLLEAGADHGLVTTWWTLDEVAVSAPGASQRLLEVLNQEPAHVRDPGSVRPGTVLKAMLCGSPEELDAVAEDVVARSPRLTRSMAEFFELSPATASKWQSLSLVLDGLGIAPEECVGFGDGGNDVPWLRKIGFPVAVANARDEVKAVARHVTGHHDEHGVADFLEWHLLPALAR